MPNKKYEIRDFLEVKSANSSSFSFDGSKVAYLSNQSGSPQLYVMSSKGGQAEQITSYEDHISFAVFSPIKDEILFGKFVGGDEQTQFYLYSLLTKKTRALTDNPKVKYNFGQFSRDGKYISYSQNSRNGKDFDVYIMDMENGETKCVYDQGGSCHAINFSPKNTYLSMRKHHTNLDVDLYLISLNDNKAEWITKHEGQAYFGATSWLPDESAFFTISNKDRDFLGINRFDMSKREFTYVYTPDWDVDSAVVSHDGSLLSTIINEDGYWKLRLMKIGSMEEVNLTALPKTGLVYSARFSKDSKYLAMSVGDSLRTTDVWIYSLNDQQCWQLTNSSQGVPPEELVEPKLFRFTSFDGLQVPAFLYMPKVISAGKKIPVIINIHGGPESQYQPSFASLTQYFVYQGYAVIAPNVRGSAGYGKKYLALDDIEKRMDSVHDLASLHEHIKTIPQLDQNKVALMGGSYGGYMTLAGLAFYPDLWVAGVDIVGMANLVTFLENTASYRRSLREAEYGYLDKHMDLLRSISPINKIENVKAPLFIIHGANDPRVPLNEAEQMHEKLTALGRKVELLVYKDEGHGLAKLKNRLDAYPKVVKFLEEAFA